MVKGALGGGGYGDISQEVGSHLIWFIDAAGVALYQDAISSRQRQRDGQGLMVSGGKEDVAGWTHKPKKVEER